MLSDHEVQPKAYQPSENVTRLINIDLEAKMHDKSEYLYIIECLKKPQKSSKT